MDTEPQSLEERIMQAAASRQPPEMDMVPGVGPVWVGQLSAHDVMQMQQTDDVERQMLIIICGGLRNEDGSPAISRQKAQKLFDADYELFAKLLTVVQSRQRMMQTAQEEDLKKSGLMTNGSSTKLQRDSESLTPTS